MKEVNQQRLLAFAKIYFHIAVLVNSRFKIQLKIEEVVYKTSVYWSSERNSMSWLDQIHTSFSDSLTPKQLQEEMVDKNQLNEQLTRYRQIDTR